MMMSAITGDPLGDAKRIEFVAQIPVNHDKALIQKMTNLDSRRGDPATQGVI